MPMPRRWTIQHALRLTAAARATFGLGTIALATLRLTALGVATLGLATLSTASTALADERAIAPPQVLKLSTAQSSAYPLGKAGELWATMIRERSGGRLAVEHFPGASLASRDPAREFGALRERAVDLAVGSTLTWAAQVPALNVVALPWLVADEADLQALLDGATGQRLFDALSAAGVVPLAWAANGFVELASRAPLRQPADLAGLTIRTQASPLLQETLAALGARPTTMSAVEARGALSNGQLDGQEASLAAYSVARLHAGPLVHLQLWQAHADALVFAVNRSAWETWSEADRTIVRDAAVAASQQARVMAQRFGADSALAALSAEGAQVTRLTPAGKAAFREATRTVRDRWKPAIGIELVEGAEAEIAGRGARR